MTYLYHGTKLHTVFPPASLEPEHTQKTKPTGKFQDTCKRLVQMQYTHTHTQIAKYSLTHTHTKSKTFTYSYTRKTKHSLIHTHKTKHSLIHTQKAEHSPSAKHQALKPGRPIMQN